MKVLEYTYSIGLTLCNAEYEPNKKNMFIATGDERIDLEYLNFGDIINELTQLLGRKLSDTDGQFYGFTNQAYIITDDIWNTLVEMNDKAKVDKQEKDKQKQIAYFEDYVKRCEKAKLYTDEQADKMEKSYVNVNNEGGSGYVPHFYTFTEYEYAKKTLEELKK